MVVCRSTSLKSTPFAPHVPPPITFIAPATHLSSSYKTGPPIAQASANPTYTTRSRSRSPFQHPRYHMPTQLLHSLQDLRICPPQANPQSPTPWGHSGKSSHATLSHGPTRAARRCRGVAPCGARPTPALGPHVEAQARLLATWGTAHAALQGGPRSRTQRVPQPPQGPPPSSHPPVQATHYPPLPEPH